MTDLRSVFLTVVAALHELGVPHAFIGALPVLAWGRVRATTDIDVVLAVADEWDRVAASLEARGLALKKRIGPSDARDPLPDIAVFYASGEPPVRVDVFLAKTQFERAVIEAARRTHVLGVEVALASPEASIIYKLLARRGRDLDDVEGIFEARQAADDRLDWAFLDRWAAEWGIEEQLAQYRERYGGGLERRA